MVPAPPSPRRSHEKRHPCRLVHRGAFRGGADADLYAGAVVIDFFAGPLFGMGCCWLYRKLRTPTHVHQWSKWEQCEATIHLYRGGSIPTTKLLRVCTACGDTETKDLE